MNSLFTRRNFLKSAAAGAALLPFGAEAAEPEDKAWAKAKHEAKWRKRRIIMNNDGNDVHHAKPDEPKTFENFLSKRTSPLVGSQVDSIFYCTGVFNYYLHPSDVTEVLYRKGVPGEYLRTLLDKGIDPLESMIAYCKDKGFEIFWSMRMNDTHDSGSPELLCQWKRDHPEYLVGEKGTRYRYGANRWSSVDYGLQPVRDKVYEILQDVATRYNVDGLELDFFRHPVLFRPQMTGEPVTDEHRAAMTGLMRRIRTLTEREGRKRGRPMLIAIRVPDSIGYLNAMGIDLNSWLEEDLVDIVTGGGYFHMTPWTEWAKTVHAHDVPAYACLVSRRLMGGGEPEAETAEKIWRGEALNAWKAGMDGIYTFNRFNPHDAIFRELGDPKLLKTLPRTNQESFVADIWSRPEVWLKDGRKYVQNTTIE